MATIELKNNAVGYLSTAISASDVGIALQAGDGAEFPVLTGDEFFYATISSTLGTYEIVKVTARSVDSLTIVRAQEGTSAASFAAGARIEMRVTAQSIFDAVKLGNILSVKDFGAVGDGVADDTAAIQAALDSNQICRVPRGRYLITSELIVSPSRNRSAGLIGEASWSNYPTTTQSGGPSWTGTQEAVIVYGGVASATTAVIRASAQPVGTLVSQTFANTIYGFRLENILLDGGNLAGFGLYGIRLSEPEVINVAVRQTTQHAFYIDQAYSGRFEKIHAFLNAGCGISVGRGELDYGWASGKFVNAVYFSDLYASANGSDKTFNQTTNPLWGYGIGLWLYRGNVVSTYTSENNDGFGLVLAPPSFPNVILGGYSELSNSYVVNGTDAITDGRATRKWGLWFVGASTASSQNMRICNVFMGAEGIRLTGTEPTAARTEGAVSLESIMGANYLEADWGNYRLINCGQELVAAITGTSPVGASVMVGGIQFDPINGERLNAYEEGTFVPSLAGSTIGGTGWAYSVATASYTLIGQRCFFSGRIGLSAVSGDATGQIIIAGLPFTIKNSNTYRGTVGCVASAMTTAIVTMEGSLSIGTTNIALTIRTAASVNTSSLTLADLSATTAITFSGHYVIA